MKVAGKKNSIVAELCWMIFTVIAALALHCLFNPYYELLRYLFYEDYVKFEAVFPHFYFPAYVLVRVALPVFGAYYLIKKTVQWLSNRAFVSGRYQRISGWGIHIRLFHTASIMLFLFVAEMYLQKSGYSSGSYYKNFQLLNKLEDNSFQYSDTEGVIKINPDSKYVPGAYGHINRDGFRSRYEFDSLSVAALKAQGKKVIMFIGDSYTEGFSAMPRDSCFVELTDRHPAYAALNCGIAGTDPLQYKLVALQYAPAIKPDAVVVVTCNNDAMQYDRLPVPGIPIFYFTNTTSANTLFEAQKPIDWGYKPNDLLKTKEEAYEFYKTYCTVPQSTLLGKLCSRSVLTTLLWYEITGYNKNIFLPRKTDYDLPYTFENLQVIKNICDSVHTPVLFFHIPEPDEELKTDTTGVAGFKLIYRNLPVSYFTGIPSEDRVSLEDKHFNNRGHAKFAAMVLNSLDSVFAVAGKN